MFSKIQLLADSDAIVARFDANTGDNRHSFEPRNEISGFEHALHPIIIYAHQPQCANARWGLIPPAWQKQPEDIWNFTISAKLEYIAKRYSWQKVAANRCLIPATAFFEYHWNDPAGRSKTKFMVKSADDDLFALAGLFADWQATDGSWLRTFVVCTTKANDIMTFVHNKDVAKNYHRMPVMLHREDEKKWLDPTIPYLQFGYPTYRPNLIAIPQDNQPVQTKLF